MTVICGKLSSNCDHFFCIWHRSLHGRDYILMQNYLACGSFLWAGCPPCLPLSVRVGGWGCQICRDALGASLPPRARWTRAAPAALHVGCTVTGCHRHLQGCRSLSETQTYKPSRVSSSITCTDAPVPAINNIKERKRSGMCAVETNLSVTQARTQAQAHTKWTKTSEIKLGLIKNNSTDMEKARLTQLHILLLLNRESKVWLQHQLSYVNSPSGFRVALWLGQIWKSLSLLY